jgi:hypothetical protein
MTNLVRRLVAFFADTTNLQSGSPSFTDLPNGLATLQTESALE